MKNLLMLFVYITISSLTSADSGHKVFGKLSEDVVLPCSFTPNSKEIIHWQRPGDIVVHSYYYGKDQLEKQDLSYQNRTSLFYYELQKGNASLRLRDLRLEDEGEYMCYMGKENKVFLNITAFKYSYLSYYIQNLTTMLQCAVWGVRPLPSITWSDANGFINETSRTENKTNGLMSVISELNITNSSQVYQCWIHSSVLNLNWRGVWNMAVSLQEVEKNEALLPCDFPHSLNLRNVHATWSRANKCLASFDNLAETVENSRVAWVPVKRHRTNFSITLKNLIFSDSGDYLCNISSHDYMQLKVTSLFVDKMPNWPRCVVLAAVFITVIIVASVICIVIYIHQLRKGKGNKDYQRPVNMEMVPRTT